MSYVAKLCFPKELEGIEVDEIKDKRKDLRQNAKGAGFAIQFGGVGYTISQNLGISPKEGEEVYQAYMDAFKGVKTYFDEISTKALKDGFVEFNEVTGRKNFFDFYDDYVKAKRYVESIDWKDYREQKKKDTFDFKYEMQPNVKKYFKLEGMIKRRSYNFPVQGSGADITKYAAIMIFNYILKNNYFKLVKIVNIVHDEILVECPEELTEEISKVVKDSMVKAGERFFTRVPLDASCDVGKYWIH